MKTCPACSDPVEIECDFGNLGEEVVCPSCKAILEIEYDEVFDGEEEHGWFYLAEKEAV